MNSLYNIFQNEKERNPDMTVYYNKQTNSISYRNEEGTLTALFRGENEYFYFKSPNKKPEEMQTNIGDTEHGASVEIGVRNKDGNIERFSGNTNWDIDKYIADSTFATAIKNVKAEIDKSHGLTPEHGSTRPKSNIER